MQRVPVEVWQLVFREAYIRFHRSALPSDLSDLVVSVRAEIARVLPNYLLSSELASLNLTAFRAQVDRLVSSLYVFFQSEGGL